MGDKVKLVTAVPFDLAQQLTKTKRIQGYNALGQINPMLIQQVKNELAKKIGYENIPIACLSKVEHKDSTIRTIGNQINKYFPVKAGDYVILELMMEEDSILSMEYSTLLELSEEIEDADGDEDEIEYILGKVEDELRVGVAEELDTAISFISFLDLEKCEFFATLNAAFKADKLQLEGVERVEIRKLSVFE